MDTGSSRNTREVCSVKSFFCESVVRNLGPGNVGRVRSRDRDGGERNGLEERGGWGVHPRVILSCPRNFPPNTGKSLSDQQPNSSSASCAEAPHASSRLFPSAAICNDVDVLAYWFSLWDVSRGGGAYKMIQVAEPCLHVIYFILAYSRTSAQMAPS